MKTAPKRGPPYRIEFFFVFFFVWKLWFWLSMLDSILLPAGVVSKEHLLIYILIERIQCYWSISTLHSIKVQNYLLSLSRKNARYFLWREYQIWIMNRVIFKTLCLCLVVPVQCKTQLFLNLHCSGVFAILLWRIFFHSLIVISFVIIYVISVPF